MKKILKDHWMDTKFKFKTLWGFFKSDHDTFLEKNIPIHQAQTLSPEIISALNGLDYNESEEDSVFYEQGVKLSNKIDKGFEMISQDPKTKEDFKRSQLDIQLKMLPMSIILNLLVAFVAFSVLYSELVSLANQLMLWLFSFSAISALRFALHVYHFADAKNRNSTKHRKVKEFFADALTISSGACWAGLILYFLTYPGISDFSYFSVIILLIGLMTGAINTMSFNEWSYRFYIIPMMVPLIVEMMVLRPSNHKPLAIVFFVFMFVLMLLHKTTVKNMGFLLKSRIVTSALSDHLKQMNSNLEIIAEESDTARKAAWKLAHYDQLTGLGNRRLLQEQLTDALTLDHKGFCAILFIDLDRFKLINDTFGHDAGDFLLESVAKRLLSSVKEEKDKVYRLGGDEFIIILHELETKSLAKLVAQRILDKLNTKYIWKGNEFYSTPSIGIHLFRTYEEKNANPDDLVKKADLAMYEAKEAGKNTYRIYDDIMQNSDNKEELTIATDLRNAIHAETLLVYFQPQVRLNEHQQPRVVGIEALVRWEHPTKGVLSPAKFLHYAEKSNLLISLNNMVLKKAIEMKAKLNKQYSWFKLLRLSVNCSYEQISENEFNKLLTMLLEQNGVSSDELCVELTEATVLKNPELVIKALETIDSKNISISIDDFGTGFSSLTYLKKFPLDELKIDRTFITNVLTDKNDQAIVNGIIGLAKNFNLSLVVEGVENADQLRYISQLGCDTIQGYYYSSPVPFKDLIATIKKIENISHTS